MRNLNHTAGRLTNRWWKLPILVFLVMVIGIFFSPAESGAQAPPPRGQSLQMIRPLVPQPEPPVEKEIRQNRQAIEKNKQELERKVEVVKTITSMEKLKDTYWRKLGRLMYCLDTWKSNSNNCKDIPCVSKLKDCGPRPKRPNSGELCSKEELQWLECRSTFLDNLGDCTLDAITWWRKIDELEGNIRHWNEKPETGGPRPDRYDDCKK